MKKNRLPNLGRPDVITGPMFSGKSEELIKRIRRYLIAGLNVKVFNHIVDKRYAKNKIASHSQEKYDAISISKPKQILKKIDGKTDVVIIDEAQFFDKTIVNVIDKLIDKGLDVIVSGLDTDFRGQPFGSIPTFMALADGEIIKLKAVCTVCKKWNATRSYRKLKNKSALVLIGAKDSYEARCKTHHRLT